MHVVLVGGDLIPPVVLLVAVEVAEVDLGAAGAVAVSDFDLDELALGPGGQLQNNGTKLKPKTKFETETMEMKPKLEQTYLHLPFVVVKKVLCSVHCGPFCHPIIGGALVQDV